MSTIGLPLTCLPLLLAGLSLFRGGVLGPRGSESRFSLLPPSILGGARSRSSHTPICQQSFPASFKCIPSTRCRRDRESMIPASRRSKGLSRRRMLISRSEEASYGTKTYRTLDDARTRTLAERPSQSDVFPASNVRSKYYVHRTNATHRTYSLFIRVRIGSTYTARCLQPASVSHSFLNLTLRTAS